MTYADDEKKHMHDMMQQQGANCRDILLVTTQNSRRLLGGGFRVKWDSLVDRALRQPSEHQSPWNYVFCKCTKMW
jgi:hypothetical protein